MTCDREAGHEGDHGRTVSATRRLGWPQGDGGLPEGQNYSVIPADSGPALFEDVAGIDALAMINKGSASPAVPVPPELRAPSKGLAEGVASLERSLGASLVAESPAPEDVAAARMFAGAAAKLTGLRSGLAAALGIEATTDDAALMTAAGQARLSLEGSRNAVKALELDRAEAVKALGLGSVDCGHLAVAIRTRIGSSPSEAGAPLEDVAARKRDLATAQAEAGRLGRELGKLRGDLQVALGLSGTATDEELVAAADRPTPGEYAALQASRDEARAAEQRERERAEKAERERDNALASCEAIQDTNNRLREELGRPGFVRAGAPEDVAAWRERAEKAEAERDEAKAEKAAEWKLLDATRVRLCERAGLDKDTSWSGIAQWVGGTGQDNARRTENLLADQRLEHERKAALASQEIQDLRSLLAEQRERAEKAERHVAELRAELTAVRGQELAAEIGASLAQRYETAREQAKELRAEIQRLEAQAASLGIRARVAEVELAQANAQLEVALAERDRARSANEELRRQLAEVQEDFGQDGRDRRALDEVLLACGAELARRGVRVRDLLNDRGLARQNEEARLARFQVLLRERGIFVTDEPDTILTAVEDALRLAPVQEAS